MSGRLDYEKPKSCIECLNADCFGHCKILKDRQEDYALKRHKNCPIGEKNNEQEKEKTLHTEEAEKHT